MILVTGYRGFLGTKLVAKLPQFVGLDVRDGMDLLTCDLPEKIHLIYHLAAQSSVESSWSDPLHDLENIRMTARLTKEYPEVKIIYANSAAALGEVSSPYGFSKKAAGEYLQNFHKNTVSCILPNIYGEGSRSVVDIFKGKDWVNIYGDGTHTRDYVHADDIIWALLKAAQWKPGEYMVASGKSTSVLELAEGKVVKFLPSRKEAKEVVMKNSTPDWKPFINVMEYLS